ncbi:MAG: response regulator [Spirochaetaceae bacterium]|jgi:class 3 adenylate cyclase/CheY-like chemotaxis protein|nr:response regulator [Spirochaetaceae bacterium]
MDNKTAKKRILVFEDSDIFADMLLEFLDGEGYETGRAVNGLEGIKMTYSFLPQLIVTDVEMPLFKGYQATRLLKSRPSTKPIPVIMFTSLGESKDKFWGGQAGADYYIEKSPENFSKLKEQIEVFLDGAPPVDYERIKREGKRINDNSLIEMVNNLLDTKLFQTTVIGLLAELSVKLSSLEEVVRGVFDLLRNICECEICTVMIKDTDNSLAVYTANHSGYTEAIAEDFKAVTIADFNTFFPDYQVVSREVEDFFGAGEKNKKIESYIMLPLKSSGEDFATVHIGNSVKEYFSPLILENINVFLSAAAPIIANALRLRQMDTLQKKTRAAFARYVPIDVMDEIIKKSSTQSSQSETRVVAVLFSDIRNFTKISEKTNAQELVTFLNAYFSLMGNEIVAEGGNIDKFIGDAIMAIFGAPKTLENASASSIRAALRMAKALSRVDTAGITLPESGFGAGIGINFGECVVGNIGFHDKLDYTVIGDTVNLASRLEGVTKYYRQSIIVSENVYAAARDEFIFRKADSVRVKGKNEAVGLYAVYAAYRGEGDGDLPPGIVLDREALDQYNKGLKLYTMREWETARQYFDQARGITEKSGGEDYLSSMYITRIGEHIQNPPPADWDATITMTEK